MKKQTTFILSLTFILLFACKKDKPTCDGSNPTYNSKVKAIINSNCTSSSCHPSYNVYSGLSSIIANGSFKREVLDNQSMPKGSAKLSQSDLNALQCWVENGYPEN